MKTKYMSAKFQGVWKTFSNAKTIIYLVITGKIAKENFEKDISIENQKESATRIASNPR
jgi:hypothetical protein